MLRKGTARGATGVILALALTGATVACAEANGGGPTVAPAQSPTPTPTVTATAGARPTYDPTAMAKLVKAVTIPRGGLLSLRALDDPAADTPGDYGISSGCNDLLDADHSRYQSYLRRWVAADWYVMNTVFGFAVYSGADVVGQARESVIDCPGYTDDDGRRHRPLGPVELPDLPGVAASYAWCELAEKSGEQTSFTCMAVLARGDVISDVYVTGRPRTRVREVLLAVAPLAAERLVERVDAPA